jgi:DsbC/DsbD-like thiol-disulfide interchange protein
MTSIKIFLSCAAALSTAMAGAAGTPSVVEARLVLSTNAVHPGSHVKAAVIARISPGYHINEHHPSLDYLIPSELKLEPPSGITVEKTVYPPGEISKFAFSDTPLSVYQGTILVGALLKVAPSVHTGNVTLKGKFSYQACNDQACFPPVTLTVSLAVPVVSRNVPLERVNGEIFGKIHLSR